MAAHVWFCCRGVLKKVWKTEVKNFLIDCSTGTLETILVQAQQIGLLTSQYSYIVTNADMHIIDMEPYMYSDTNITGVRFFGNTNRLITFDSHFVTDTIYPAC